MVVMEALKDLEDVEALNASEFLTCEQSLIISKEQTFTLIKDKYPKVSIKIL
jgi:hypothetical protein